MFDLLGVPSLLQQLGLAYLGYKSLPLLIQLALIVCPTLVVLASMWMAVRKPLVAAILLPAFLGIGVWIWWIYPVKVPPAPLFKGTRSVSAGWAAREGWWGAYWTDRAIPNAWKPYEALIRIRIGKDDLYIVMKGGKILATGPYDIRAMEPLAGK